MFLCGLINLAHVKNIKIKIVTLLKWSKYFLIFVIFVYEHLNLIFILTSCGDTLKRVHRFKVINACQSFLRNRNQFHAAIILARVRFNSLCLSGRSKEFFPNFIHRIINKRYEGDMMQLVFSLFNPT